MITFNGKPINVTLFPDGTSQVWQLNQEILETTNYAHIVWEFSHEGEFMHLAQLKTLLDKYQFNTTLRLPYLPYGRQDKDVSNTETFALRVFARLLNELCFDEVIIMDPHSSVAMGLIDNAHDTYPEDIVQQTMALTNADLICYPDEGALIKYSGFKEKIYDYPFVAGKKNRDRETGTITDYVLYGDVLDKKVLIVDDICDGGATFRKLAWELFNNGAKEVHLFVTHGIFSKGLRPLHEAGIKRIFTAKGEVSEYQQQITYRRL